MSHTSHITPLRSAKTTGWNSQRWLKDKPGYFVSALSPAAHNKQQKSNGATIQTHSKATGALSGAEQEQGRSSGFHFQDSVIIEWSIFDLMTRVDLQPKRKRECRALWHISCCMYLRIGAFFLWVKILWGKVRSVQIFLYFLSLLEQECKNTEKLHLWQIWSYLGMYIHSLKINVQSHKCVCYDILSCTLQF